MVALKQNLIAAAHADHFAADPIYARVITGADQKHNRDKNRCEGADHSHFSRKRRDMAHCRVVVRFGLHQSPAPTGAGRTRISAGMLARTVARTGAAFETITRTPTQIQETRGFRWALIMGRPVSGFWPSYTR